MLRKVYHRNCPLFMLGSSGQILQKLRRISRKYFSNFTLLSFPLNIEIETISGCNARCVMCPNSNTDFCNVESPVILDYRIYKKIVDEISYYQPANIFLCARNEPLLDNRIIEFICYAKNNCPKTKIVLNTNASLLTSKLSDEILHSGLDRIIFSIHGWTMQTMLKVSGLNFDSIIKNVTYFLKKAKFLNSKIDIGLNCQKTIYFTDKDYDFAFSFSRMYNLDFTLLTPTNRAGSIKNISYQLNRKVYKKKIHKCTLDAKPLTSATILSDGSVVPCCMDWYREEILGDIYKDSLYDIWHGEKYSTFRTKVHRQAVSAGNFLCKRCSESA